MTALIKPRMTVDEYFAWAEMHPGRYELHRGEVRTKSPEGAGHVVTKGCVHVALSVAVRTCRLPCHVLPDGATVRIDETTAYEPDALVYCGPKLSPSAIEVPNPLVVVEVLSPWTLQIDAVRGEGWDEGASPPGSESRPRPLTPTLSPRGGERERCRPPFSEGGSAPAGAKLAMTN